MKPKAFIFIGPSGSGKGTQAKRLMAYVEEISTGEKVFSISTGAKFREFIKGEKYTNQLSKKIYDNGARQPDFLAVHLWAQVLVDEFDGTTNLLFDGAPRSLGEARMLATAIDFLGVKEVFIVFINTSRQWSIDRLTERGRFDDVSSEIEKRLNWYEKDVVPAVEFFRSHPTYTFFEINGEQTKDEVWEEIKGGIWPS